MEILRPASEIEMVSELKKIYKTYPDYGVRNHKNDSHNVITITSLVRIEREGVYYLIRTISSRLFNTIGDIILSEDDMIRETLDEFLKNVYRVIHLYKVSDRDYKDDNQESEIDRLIKLDPILSRKC